MIFRTILGSILLTMAHVAISAQTLHFASEATYPPFESMDQQGHIIGFDIDIANALCAQMHAECHFSNQPWNSLIPSLKLGKFDAVISSMAITDERKHQVSFTDPYYLNSASFVAAVNHTLQLTPSGLQNKIVGVQEGTVLEQYLRQAYGQGVKIKTYPSIRDAFLDLQSGRVNTVFADTPIIQAWVNKQPAHTFAMIGQPISGGALFQEGFGIAVRKDNTALVKQLNQALAVIKADGTYDKIYEQYFGKPTQQQ